MKLSDAFPSAQAFKTLLSSNKRRLQKLICDYLTYLAQRVDAYIIYSVGTHCTNLSTQQPMEKYRFDQSEADAVLFSFYAVLRESGYSGPVVIDTYAAAAVIYDGYRRAERRTHLNLVVQTLMRQNGLIRTD